MEVIEDLRGKLDPWAFNLVIIAIGVLIGLIIEFVLFRILKMSAEHSDYYLIDSIISRTRKSFGFFFPVLVITLLMPLLQLDEEWRSIAQGLIEAVLIISFAWLLISFVRILEDYVVNTYQISKEDNFKERKIRTQLQFIRKLSILVIFLIAISVILLQFEGVRKIGTGLLTSAGVAGIIIGFAAQRTIASLLAGFQIAFTQPIRIDDVVIVENEWGRIEEINLTYVVVRIWDQRRLVLPINYFLDKPFQNWTRTSAEIWGTVFLYTDYTIPVGKLKDELSKILDSTDLWDKKVGVLQVTDATEKTMELRAIVSARNSGEAWDLRCLVREKLIEYVQREFPDCLPKTRALVGDSLPPKELLDKLEAKEPDRLRPTHDE